MALTLFEQVFDWNSNGKLDLFETHYMYCGYLKAVKKAGKHSIGGYSYEPRKRKHIILNGYLKLINAFWRNDEYVKIWKDKPVVYVLTWIKLMALHLGTVCFICALFDIYMPIITIINTYIGIRLAFRLNIQYYEYKGIIYKNHKAVDYVLDHMWAFVISAFILLFVVALTMSI